jgi:alanine-glyoxylate transaminase/serine-glyoxylate transaminase/serine-pyruvate transaminase
VPDEVMHAMQRPMTDLADPRVAALIAACETGMKDLLNSPASDVFFYASNGHGVWEAASANLGSEQHSLLIAGSGHFSDQWAIQTSALGLSVIRTPHTEGQQIDVAAIEAALQADTQHQIAAVMVVHTDTARALPAIYKPFAMPLTTRGTQPFMWLMWWPRWEPHPLTWMPWVQMCVWAAPKKA